MKIRVKWSDVPHNHPIKFRIPDWTLVKRVYANQYLVVDAVMDYKDRDIELCVPYNRFIMTIRTLPVEQQKWIKYGKAVITIMKTYMKIEHGMIIKEVKEWKRNG